MEPVDQTGGVTPPLSDKQMTMTTRRTTMTLMCARTKWRWAMPKTTIQTMTTTKRRRRGERRTAKLLGDQLRRLVGWLVVQLSGSQEFIIVLLSVMLTDRRGT